MSLIEVVAAIMVIVIVALAGAGVTINGINTATAQERSQVAVTIANGVMEKLSGWTVATDPSTHVSALYAGRCTSQVTTAFSANSTRPGVSATYPVSDTTAATCTDAAFPPLITGVDATQNNTIYTITTLIGACYEPVTGGSCGRLTGQSSPPATTPAGYTAMIREIVIVGWTAGSTCKVNGCFYQTTSLANANTDLQWVTHG